MDSDKDFRQDYFALFGLPRGYRIDRSELEHRYHEIQTRIHPDKHVGGDGADRRLAMQWATRVNEAYRTLREPLGRARYLLQLADIELDRSGALSTEFLMQQLEWREAVEEARSVAAVSTLGELHRRLSEAMEEQYVVLAAAFDDMSIIDYSSVSDRVRRLMFQEKLLFEIDDALAGVEA